MKKIALTMAMCMLYTCGFSKTENNNDSSEKSLVAPVNALFLEFGASSNGLGIGYERKLLKDEQLYLRTGLGYGYSDLDVIYQPTGSEQWYWGDGHTISYTLPVGATYLLRNHRSKLELGIGTALTYQHSSGDGGYKDNEFTANVYCNVGWRWQARSGFLLRMGLSPVYSLNKDNVWNDGVTIGNHDKRYVLGFYLGVGWAF